jgi:pimeloyl-ACP methyl ester carboxylesterase
VSDVFISYARATAGTAQAAAGALRTLGYSVWVDDQLPVHQAYPHVIAEQLDRAKAALVFWSSDAAKSEWVMSEANRAREARKLVQARLDAARLPMPFDQIQCADLSGWAGGDHPEWRKVTQSLAALLGREASPQNGARLEQEIRYCKAADGVRIAYASVGQGPPLVKTANWLNHLEYDWDGPIWSQLFQRMAARHTLVRYDERGNGLSDRDVENLSLDAFVHDLEAVADAAGLERFPICASSQGGPVAIAFAARHPERVSRLVLLNAFSRGWRCASSPTTIAHVEALKVLIVTGWGTASPAFRQVFTTLMIPSATAYQTDAFDGMQRATATPQMAAALVECFGQMDVRSSLAEVRAPTLVMHCRDDRFIPPKLGQEIAAGIPGARFVSLPSANHILLPEEPAFEKMLTEMEAFLAQDA